MDILALALALVIVGICGAIAELIVGFRPGGVLISVIVGVVGAYIGNVAAQLLFVPPLHNLKELLYISVGTIEFDLVWATLGSVLVVFLLAMLRSRRMLGFANRRSSRS